MTKIFICLLPLFALTACQSTIEAKQKTHSGRHVKATWYGVGDGSGSHTASGQRFNPYAIKVAHKTLPFGTKLKVTNPRNNKSVIVVVNDRGPFVKGIELDLTKGAANAIGMSGTQTIIMERVIDG